MPPQPYRFKSTTLRFQIPGLDIPELLLKSRYIRDFTASDTWKASMRIFHNVRTWARRTIWGDRVGFPAPQKPQAWTYELNLALSPIRGPRHSPRPVSRSPCTRYYER